MYYETKATIVAILLILLCGFLTFGGVYYWMRSSCNEISEMQGYKLSKTVGTKCYASNDGKLWSKVWY